MEIISPIYDKNNTITDIPTTPIIPSIFDNNNKNNTTTDKAFKIASNMPPPPPPPINYTIIGTINIPSIQPYLEEPPKKNHLKKNHLKKNHLKKKNLKENLKKKQKVMIMGVI
eukprot:999_1